MLQSAGVHEAFLETREKVTAANAIDYLLRDKANPSSVMSCIEAGRNNARMVRTALTRETWEATNEFWIELKNILGRKLSHAELPQTIDVIKHRAGLVRGAFHGSMLRNDLYNFSRIGTFIERADNTARILDVKYYVLLPAVAMSAPRSTMRNGNPSCARSRRTAPMAGSMMRSTSRPILPTSSFSTAACRARSPIVTKRSPATSIT